MSGRSPDEIWDESVKEGSRRLQRGTLGMASTGVIGGVDVMIGIMALTVVSGALAVVVPEPVAHVGGSLVFGVGFVLIILGRSELFTENFLVPIAPVLRRLAPVSAVARLWTVTALANLVGIFVLAAIFTRAGLVPPETLDAAGKVADTFAERDFIAALLSAIIAGTVMTLFTWIATAVELDVARIGIALIVGFILAAPSLNHAIVGFGEMSFGLLAGTTSSAEWIDVAQNFPVSVLGNLIGGLGFVTLARVLQVQGEPDDGDVVADD